jgi:hypothetical protein
MTSTQPVENINKNQKQEQQQVVEEEDEVDTWETMYNNTSKSPFGNRVFICCGKIHVSKDWKISLVMAFVIVSAVSLLCTSTIDYFNRSDGSLSAGWIVGAAINVVLGIAALTNLFLCVFVEPGIIAPKIFYDQNPHIPNPDPIPLWKEGIGTLGDITRKIQIQVDHKNDHKITITTIPWNEEKHKEQQKNRRIGTNDRMYIPGDDIDVYNWESQICRTCLIWRPIRSGHCHWDGVCVEGYDHKCQVVGACIGKRNWAYFFMFNFCTSLLGVSLIVTAVCSLAISVDWEQLNSDHRLNQWRLASAIIVILEAFIGGWFTLMFAIKYTMYACEGITAKDAQGWREEAKLIARMNRGGKSDCGTCVDMSCVWSCPESNKPY